MTVSIPSFANFIARCELFCLEWDGLIFQSALFRWNMKLIGTLMVSRHPAPCLSGVLPIWLFNDSPHLFLHFYRPLWIIPRRVKWFEFSVGTMEVKHQTLRLLRMVCRHQARVYQGYLPIWLFNHCLITYQCIFYRSLWIITRRVKWFVFSVGTMNLKYQSHRRFFVKNFPLFGAM